MANKNNLFTYSTALDCFTKQSINASVKTKIQHSKNNECSRQIAIANTLLFLTFNQNQPNSH